MNPLFGYIYMNYICMLLNTHVVLGIGPTVTRENMSECIICLDPLPHHEHVRTSGRGGGDSPGWKRERIGLYTILQLPILYGVWQTQGGSEGERILPNSRAIVLQQCGQCKWAGGMKEQLIRGQTTTSKRLSCKSQKVLKPTC